MRDCDLYQFPPGTRVKTPTGRTGIVIKHRRGQSKTDHFDRLTVRLDGGDRHALVTLQPRLLRLVEQTNVVTQLILNE